MEMRTVTMLSQIYPDYWRITTLYQVQQYQLKNNLWKLTMCQRQSPQPKIWSRVWNRSQNILYCFDKLVNENLFYWFLLFVIFVMEIVLLSGIFFCENVASEPSIISSIFYSPRLSKSRSGSDFGNSAFFCLLQYIIIGLTKSIIGIIRAVTVTNMC